MFRYTRRQMVLVTLGAGLLAAGCTSPTEQARSAPVPTMLISPETPTPSSPPSVAPSPPTPTVLPSPPPTTEAWQGIILYVGNTDGDGVFVRRAPGTEERIKAWPDRTAMEVIGPPQDVDGRAWKNVKSPDGVVGWVPAEYLEEATPTPAATTKPTTAGDLLIPRLDGVLPLEGKGKVLYSEGIASVQFTISDGLFLSTVAKARARDFIFAAYSSGLPVRAAQIVIMQPGGKLGLSVTLGANVAATQPPSIWNDRSVGPTIFINWMKDRARFGSSRQGADRAYVGGPWAD